MRIGIDVDNTMTNTFDYLIELKKKYGINMEDDYHNWDTDVKDEFLKLHIKEIWENCKLKVNCKEVIDKLRIEGHKIIVTSYRQDVYDIDSLQLLKDYFKKNNIVVDEIYTGIKDKGDFCKNHLIDLFIDDKLNNLDDVSNVGINVLQFYNRFEKTGEYTVVKNWDEVYRIISDNN